MMALGSITVLRDAAEIGIHLKVLRDACVRVAKLQNYARMELKHRAFFTLSSKKKKCIRSTFQTSEDCREWRQRMESEVQSIKIRLTQQHQPDLTGGRQSTSRPPSTESGAESRNNEDLSAAEPLAKSDSQADYNEVVIREAETSTLNNSSSPPL